MTIGKKMSKIRVSVVQIAYPGKLLRKDKCHWLFSYVNWVTNEIGEVLRKYKIKIVFKSSSKMSQILPFPKDTLNPLIFRGFIVYLVYVAKSILVNWSLSQNSVF